MKVKDIMENKPQYVAPETTLTEAAKLLRDNDFGFLPIGENDRLIGTVTDRDMIIKGIAEGWDPNTKTVRDVMNDKVFYCYEEDSLEKAAGYLENLQIHRLIVLNTDKRMTGIVSVGDFGRKCQNDEMCGQIVEGISEDAA